MIFYTNRFIPDQHLAVARGPLIFVRPECRGDKGLLAHEKVHRRQWWRTLGVHSLLYLFVPEYRLAAEVEAFREQARHYLDDRMPTFARLLATNYGLKITVDSALAALLEDTDD